MSTLGVNFPKCWFAFEIYLKWKNTKTHYSEQKRLVKSSIIIIFTYRVLKCDIIKNLLCETIGFFGVLWKSNIQKAYVYLPKISISGQTVFEILTQLFSEDSIQICLNLTQFITSGTKSNLEGFVWSHQSKTGLVYLRQFAPQC